MTKTYIIKDKHGKMKTQKGQLRQIKNNLYYFRKDYLKAWLLGKYIPLYCEVNNSLIYKTFVSKCYIASQSGYYGGLVRS